MGSSPLRWAQRGARVHGTRRELASLHWLFSWYCPQMEHVADTSFAIDGHWLEVRLGCAASISNQPKPIHQLARSHKGMVKPAQSEARVRILCCCCSRNASTADGRPGAPYLFSHPPSSKRQARRQLPYPGWRVRARTPGGFEGPSGHMGNEEMCSSRSKPVRYSAHWLSTEPAHTGSHGVGSPWPSAPAGHRKTLRFFCKFYTQRRSP